MKAYGLRQEFIAPYSPEQNGVVERFIRSMKEECVWQNRFESIAHGRTTLSSCIRHYNTERPH
ncbi:MAG: transposase [Pseudomonadota bacterium]